MNLITKENKKTIIILFLLCSLEIIATALLPTTKGIFFQSLAIHAKEVWIMLTYMLINYTSLEIFQAIKECLKIKAAQRGRKAISHLFLKHVTKLASGAQRIQEDIKLYYQNMISVYAEYYISIFTVILLISINIHQPQLVVGAIIYSVLALGINKLFNKSMRTAEFIVQQSETELRDDLRINSRLGLLDKTIDCNLIANMIRFKYALFSRAQNLLLIFLPYIVLVPLFLTHKINLGTFMSASSTFSLIALNATILITLYPVFTTGLASKDRLEELKK